MNGEQWLATICDLGSSVWENAALPENYWNQDNEGFEDSNIHLPPTLSGVSDGAIDLVSDYPQLIKLAYDVGTKEEVRTGIWTAVKNITPSSIVDAATGAVKDKWDKYANSKPFVTSHELGKDGVAVASAIMGASFFKPGDDALEDSVEKTGKEIKSKADDLIVNGTGGIDDVAKKNLKEGLANGEFSKEIVEDFQDEINDKAVKQGKKLTWDEVKALFKRGNDFNKKAIDEGWDKFNEVTLSNGKRLDGYTPPLNGKLGEIVSRKATDLEKIKIETFEGYLKELKTKYPIGETINAPKYGSQLKGKILEGKQILEIPQSNKSFAKIQEYIDLAKSDKYKIEIRFRAE